MSFWYVWLAMMTTNGHSPQKQQYQEHSIEVLLSSAAGPLAHEVALKVHPSANGRIIINYPGLNGDVDGWNDKYGKIGNHISGRLGATVRLGNWPVEGVEYGESVCAILRSAIEWSINNSQRICSSGDPEVYLAGFSAGAGACAAVAHEFPQITKMLLMAPAGNAGGQAIQDGLARYRGELYSAVGLNDNIVGADAADNFASMAVNAAGVAVETFPECDHQFRGERNGRLMSAAYEWAFDDSVIAVDPANGIKLYD